METAIVYCSYIRMEKKMETTGFAGIKYRDYRVYIGLLKTRVRELCSPS